MYYINTYMELNINVDSLKLKLLFSLSKKKIKRMKYPLNKVLPLSHTQRQTHTLCDQKSGYIITFKLIFSEGSKAVTTHQNRHSYYTSKYNYVITT